MNILICMPTLADGKGGSERVAAELGVAMKSRGHSISYAFRNSPAHNRPQYPIHMDAPVLRYDDSLRGIRQFRRQISGLRPDLILTFYANWQIFEIYNILRDLDIPLCFQECSNPQRILTANWTNATNAYAMRAEILAKSVGIRVTQPEYIKSFPANIQPLVHAFPNAFTRAASIQHKKGAKTILHVGAAKKNKNPDTMLDAFALLAPRFPDWKLILCTTTPPRPKPEYEAVKRRVENEFTPASVRLLENVEDMAPLYANADIHCITSMSEGLPNCVCEAMCQGTPSVGFAQSIGTNLLIRNGVDGLLAGNGPAALAQTLEALMTNPDLTRKLGENAWQEAEKFDPATIYDQWEEFFQNSLKRAKKMPPAPEPPDIARLCTPWTDVASTTWRGYLEDKINALSGEIIFYGCGSLYREFKYLFSHLKPVCVILDKKSGQREIDGLKIITPKELGDRLKNSSIAIFSKDAKVIEHRLISEYGAQGEIICIDRKILRDRYLSDSPHPLTSDQVHERFTRLEAGLPTYKVNKEPFSGKVNTEHPDCAFCGSNHTLPYMTSQLVPWYGNELFSLARCEKCGLIYNNPRPPENYTLAQLNKIGHLFYDQKLHRPNVQAIHDLYAKELLLQKPDAKKIFDVAFGAGTLLHSFKKLGVEACGNEINSFACSRLKEQGFEVYNTPTRLLKLEEQFDIITMLDYVEHTYTPFDDLLKARSMLRPNGLLYLKTLDIGCPAHLRKGELWQLFGKGHFYYYLANVLAGMIENAGFDILNIRRNSLVHVLAKKR